MRELRFGGISGTTAGGAATLVALTPLAQKWFKLESKSNVIMMKRIDCITKGRLNESLNESAETRMDTMATIALLGH